PRSSSLSAIEDKICPRWFVPCGPMTSTTTTDIRPFRIEVPQAALDDLADRLARTRWGADLPGDDPWARGVPASYLRGLVERWATAYDWREHEARINELPQFTT